MSTPSSRQEILPALLLVLTAWSLLATQALLAPHLGRGAAVLLSFAAVTALVIATRRREGDRAPGRAAGLAALGALAGFASYPVWIPLIGAIGVALGLRPVPPPPRPDDPLLLVAVLGLAPVFEELLYRERLLLALRSRVGAGLAVAISSLLFALPHLEPWSVLATGLVGLALGALMLAGGSVALCIGLHAGLNLAAVVCGIPPARLALPDAARAPRRRGNPRVGLLAARRGRLGDIAIGRTLTLSCGDRGSPSGVRRASDVPAVAAGRQAGKCARDRTDRLGRERAPARLRRVATRQLRQVSQRVPCCRDRYWNQRASGCCS